MITLVRDRKPWKNPDPWYGYEAQVLMDCMIEAGLGRDDVRTLFLSDGDIHAQLRRAKPSCVVALGSRCASTLRGESVKVEDQRGFVFTTKDGWPVVPTVDPGLVGKVWVPWRALLRTDLLRAQQVARGEYDKPSRKIHVVTSSRDARHAFESLGRYGVLGADIETRGDLSVACIGLAGEVGEGYVFPSNYLSGVADFLREQSVTTVWANGIYDLFVLKYLEGWDIPGQVEDVQLAWHSCYPELAGQRVDGKKRHTRKSLSFLSSLYTWDEYWKDYNFKADSMEQYVLNGRDVCITLEIWEKIQGDLHQARSTYEHERGLMWPCVDMLWRGLRIDDNLRRMRVEALDAMVQEVEARANEVVIPIIEREWERIKDQGYLFEHVDPVCSCCRHAKKKQHRCWGCAGFDKAPTKAELEESCNNYAWWAKGKPANKLSKAELEDGLLDTCKVCGGKPRGRWLHFNPNSDAQAKVLLYDVLRLPKRMNDGKLTTNEEALKSILGAIS